MGASGWWLERAAEAALPGLWSLDLCPIIAIGPVEQCRPQNKAIDFLGCAGHQGSPGREPGKGKAGPGKGSMGKGRAGMAVQGTRETGKGIAR